MTSIEIKRIRKNHNVTVSQFAVMLGLSGDNAADTVRKFENGTKSPTGPVLALLSRLEAEVGPLISKSEWDSIDVKAARKVLGLSQKDLAVVLDIACADISVMEDGRAPIMKSMMLAIKYLLVRRH